MTNSIKITYTLDVKSHSEPDGMTWYDAMAKFGPDGSDKDWRLPTRKEGTVMSLCKKDIPGLNTEQWHWTSTENSISGAWIERFSDGTQHYSLKYLACYVRTVRR